MSKINTITRITSEVLDKYRSSIPRKAFIRAMERIAEEVVTIGEIQPTTACPGIEIIKHPRATAEDLADYISGACPPYAEGAEEAHCCAHSCRECWLSWLTTGLPPHQSTEGGTTE